MTINTSGFLGDTSVNVNIGLCAGLVTMKQGEAIVRDDCFTGQTNVVLCTDTTTASPIRCAPSPGSLLVAGNGNDVVSYARIR
jgi:hypothetical protein